MERRGAFGRLRLALPAAPAVAAGALVAVVLLAVAIVGGLRWADDEKVVTAPRVVANIALADNLGSLDSGLGAVWAADTAKGQILRLDPRTRQVRARIPVDGEALVTVGAGAVWVLNERNRLLRIDPASNRVTARTVLRRPAGGQLSGLEVQILAGAPWVIGLEGALRINARDGRVEHVTRLDQAAADPQWVIGSEDGIWVSAATSGCGATTWLGPPHRRMARAPPRRERAAPDPGRAGVHHARGRDRPRRRRRRAHRLAAQARHQRRGPPGPARLDALDPRLRRRRARPPRRARPRQRRDPVPASLPEFGAAGAAFVGRQLWLTTPGGRLMVLER